MEQDPRGYTAMTYSVYGMDPRTSKGMEPNREALEELFTAIMSAGIEHTNPTHGTLAGAIADEKLIPNLSRIMKSGPDNVIGIQCGFETGSLRLIDKYADRKLAPYSPEEWHWVVKEGVKTLNEDYWIPAFTLIMGLDNDETPEDSWETIRLINELEQEQPESMFTATASYLCAYWSAGKVRVLQYRQRDGPGPVGCDVQDMAAQLQVWHSKVHDQDRCPGAAEVLL